VRSGTVNGVRASILILLVVVAVSGCAGRSAAPVGAPRAASGADPIPVVASFYPLYEFAARIGGEHASVRVLVPAGAEPHDYEPTARDIAGLTTNDFGKDGQYGPPNLPWFFGTASSGINTNPCLRT